MPSLHRVSTDALIQVEKYHFYEMKGDVMAKETTARDININETRHCTAADTGLHGVYLSTEPVSRRLSSAGKLDCTSAFPVALGS